MNTEQLELFRYFKRVMIRYIEGLYSTSLIKTCPKCNGSGLSKYTEIRDGQHIYLSCTYCFGEGELRITDR